MINNKHEVLAVLRAIADGYPLKQDLMNFDGPGESWIVVENPDYVPGGPECPNLVVNVAAIKSIEIEEYPKEF